MSPRRSTEHLATAHGSPDDAHGPAAKSASSSTSQQPYVPYIAPDADVAELTPKAVLLGALFGILFGAATVYLALRAGLTISASIPISVLSIAVFKKLGKSTILENNIVQTLGSAGES
ncbi:MAG TPA: OPT/YSL family transporter, partial [Pseudomonadota bacterium]|nr:OPT/YSL family transporter [Pseudomonadota bacterium]